MANGACLLYCYSNGVIFQMNLVDSNPKFLVNLVTRLKLNGLGKRLA